MTYVQMASVLERMTEYIRRMPSDPLTATEHRHRNELLVMAEQTLHQLRDRRLIRKREASIAESMGARLAVEVDSHFQRLITEHDHTREELDRLRARCREVGVSTEDPT